MSKGSGGTRTVSSANAAASRTYAQSAIGGSVKKNTTTQNTYKELSTKDYFAALDKAVNPITNLIFDKLYSFKDYLSSSTKKYVDDKTEKGFYEKIANKAKENGFYKNNDDFADYLAIKIRDFYAEKKQKELNIGVKKNPQKIGGISYIDIAKGYTLQYKKI